MEDTEFAAPGNVMNRKPRILLIPNVAWWIIGEMGKQIVARFGDKYEFYFLPEGLLERRPELLQALVPAVDAIHCLNESSIGLFRNFDQETLPPIATWIHHVTTWSPDHQMAIERSSALTVCTRGWKEYLDARVLGRIPVTIVPHGIDAKFFNRRKINPERFGIPPGRFVLGFVGNKGSDSDRGRKGTDVLFDVVRNAAGRLPNLHVVLGGPGWEEELTELRALNISASATGYIRKSDLPALYSALDVYLLTSRVEGGPCTVFEAMACETAVVSTRVGAVPELIVDGVNGYSAEVNDGESLLSAVVTLGQAPEKRFEIGKSARASVLQRSWGAVLTPLEGVYDYLVQLRSNKGSPLPGPAWMSDPRALLQASCAADALANIVPRVRNRSISPGKGIRLLLEMTNGQSIVDIAKGAAMVKGWSFKTGSAPGLKLQTR
jgi:glycosyltransferase involved in cell wall biosynthesis